MKPQSTAESGKRKHHAPRRPSLEPWPSVGFVTLPQFMHALAVRSPQTVYSYVQQGLLPPPEPIGPNRVGWRVDVARQALDELPQRVRRNGTGETLTARRVAAHDDGRRRRSAQALQEVMDDGRQPAVTA